MESAPTFRVLLVFIILSVVGYALLPLLSVQYLPENRTSTLRVDYQWPGATPDVLEQKVTSVLEASVGLVEGIRKTRSVSGVGSGNIWLTLDASAPVDLVKYQVANRLRQLYRRLPVGVTYPQVRVLRVGNKEEERPLLVWSVSGAWRGGGLHHYAMERLAPQLALEKGVGRVLVAGGNSYEWQVEYDGQLLNRLSISRDEALAALKRHFERTPLGIVEDNHYRQNVVLGMPQEPNPQRLKSVLDHIVIARRGGRVIKLKEIGTVKYVETKTGRYYRVNGLSGVRLLLYLSPGANSIDVAERLQQRMNELTAFLPRGLFVQLEHNEAAFLKNELNKVKQRTLWSLGILLVFVLLAYRSMRQLFTLLLGLTATLGISVAGYYLFDVQLHLYAFAGITVSFGIIVDNAIVVIHHLRQRSRHAVLPALLASTLTTLAALVVLWYLPTEWRMKLVAFGQVLAINLAASLVVAWWLIPALLQKFGLLNQNAGKAAGPCRRFGGRGLAVVRFYRRVLGWMVQRRSLSVCAFVLLFGLPVFMLPGHIDGWHWYNKTIGSDWYIEKLKPVIDKALGGTLRLFSWYVWEASTWRQPEATRLYIEGKMPQGGTVEQLNEVFKSVESFLSQYGDGIEKFVTEIEGADYGLIVVTFDDEVESASPYILRNKLVAFSLNFGGVKWNIYGVGKGFSNDNSNSTPVYQVRLTGYNRGKLQQYAARLADKLGRHPRVRDIVEDANLNWWEKDRFVYQFSLNQEAMARSGLAPQVLSVLMDRFNKTQAPDYLLPDGTPVKLTPIEASENDAWTLMHQPQSLDSLRVFMPDIGKIEMLKAPLTIHKEEQQYIQMLKFTYAGSYRFGYRFLENKLQELDKEMLPGFAAAVVEHSLQRAGSRHLKMLLLVVGLIFFICALTFESLRQPFVMILCIPLSFVGIFLTYYCFDFPLDQGGYTSFLMVSGLAVNGLILVQNEFNALRKAYPSRSEVEIFVKAINKKFLPVFLSVTSTVFGLIPFTMHGTGEVFWFSLAVGTMGGLLFSLIVLLFMMPVFLCRKK